MVQHPDVPLARINGRQPALRLILFGLEGLFRLDLRKYTLRCRDYGVVLKNFRVRARRCQGEKVAGALHWGLSGAFFHQPQRANLRRKLIRISRHSPNKR